MFFNILKNQKKRKQRMRRIQWKQRSGKHKREIVFFGFLTSRKKRQKEIQENSWLLTTNDSTNMLIS